MATIPSITVPNAIVPELVAIADAWAAGQTPNPFADNPATTEKARRWEIGMIKAALIDARTTAAQASAQTTIQAARAQALIDAATIV